VWLSERQGGEIITIYVTMRQAEASMNALTLEETVPTAEVQRTVSAM
jgi:hypothetical protein